MRTGWKDSEYAKINVKFKRSGIKTYTWKISPIA